MKLDIDFSGLEIAHEEMRGYFRTCERAHRVLDRVSGSYDGSLTTQKIRHQLPLTGHVERDFWILIGPDDHPLTATDHLKEPS